MTRFNSEKRKNSSLGKKKKVLYDRQLVPGSNVRGIKSLSIGLCPTVKKSPDE